MKLSDQEKSSIKFLLSSPHWKVIESLAEQIIGKIREDSVIKDSEWETLKSVVDSEGQIKGIRRLFQELWLQLNEQK